MPDGGGSAKAGEGIETQGAVSRLEAVEVPPPAGWMIELGKKLGIRKADEEEGMGRTAAEAEKNVHPTPTDLSISSAKPSYQQTHATAPYRDATSHPSGPPFNSSAVAALGSSSTHTTANANEKKDQSKGDRIHRGWLVGSSGKRADHWVGGSRGMMQDLESAATKKRGLDGGPGSEAMGSLDEKTVRAGGFPSTKLNPYGPSRPSLTDPSAHPSDPSKSPIVPRDLPASKIPQTPNSPINLATDFSAWARPRLAMAAYEDVLAERAAEGKVNANTLEPIEDILMWEVDARYANMQKLEEDLLGGVAEGQSGEAEVGEEEGQAGPGDGVGIVDAEAGTSSARRSLRHPVRGKTPQYVFPSRSTAEHLPPDAQPKKVYPPFVFPSTTVIPAGTQRRSYDEKKSILGNIVPFFGIKKAILEHTYRLDTSDKINTLAYRLPQEEAREIIFTHSSPHYPDADLRDLILLDLITALTAPNAYPAKERLRAFALSVAKDYPVVFLITAMGYAVSSSSERLDRGHHEGLTVVFEKQLGSLVCSGLPEIEAMRDFIESAKQADLNEEVDAAMPKVDDITLQNIPEEERRKLAILHEEGIKRLKAQGLKDDSPEWMIEMFRDVKAAAWLKRFEAWVRVEPNAEGIIIEEHGGVPAVLEVDNAGDRDTQGGSGIAEGGSDPEAGGPHADETKPTFKRKRDSSSTSSANPTASASQSTSPFLSHLKKLLAQDLAANVMESAVNREMRLSMHENLLAGSFKMEGIEHVGGEEEDGQEKKRVKVDE